MMKIGELSKVAGCSVQTIRHYEKEQLIASVERSEGNFRLYDEAAVAAAQHSQLLVQFSEFLNTRLHLLDMPIHHPIHIITLRTWRTA